MKIHSIIRVVLEQVFNTKSWQLWDMVLFVFFFFKECSNNYISPNGYFLSSLLQILNVVVEQDLIDVRIHIIGVMQYLLSLCFV